MSEMITLELPGPLAQSARAIAQRTSRRVEDVLVEWLGRAASDVPIASLPDEQVLAPLLRRKEVLRHAAH